MVRQSNARGNRAGPGHEADRNESPDTALGCCWRPSDEPESLGLPNDKRARLARAKSARLAFGGLLGPEFYDDIGQELQGLRDLYGHSAEGSKVLMDALTLITRGWCLLTGWGLRGLVQDRRAQYGAASTLLQRAVMNLEAAYSAVQAAREFLPGGLLNADQPTCRHEAAPDV